MSLFGTSNAKRDQEYNTWLQEKAQLEQGLAKAAAEDLNRRRHLWPALKTWFLAGAAPKTGSSQVQQLEELFLSTDPAQIESAILWIHSEATTLSGRSAAPMGAEELTQLAELSARQQKNEKDYRAALRTLLARQLLLVMGQGQMEGYKGSFTLEELAKIRAWALASLPEAVTKLINDEELKAMLQMGRLASQAVLVKGMTDREKEFLLAIGDGMHTYRRLSESLGVTRRAVELSADFKRLVAGGFVLDDTFETGIPADKVHLFHLSQAGADLYRQLTGKDPYLTQCRKFWDKKENAEYDRRQGFWIDDLRAHARIHGLQVQVEATRNLAGTDRSVRPDLTLFKDGSTFKSLPVQVELGGKDWTRQKDQVRAGVWKAASVFGQVDVFVENNGQAEMFAKALETPPSDLKDLKLPGKVPVRIYILGVLTKDYGKWPLEDGMLAEKIFLGA